MSKKDIILVTEMDTRERALVNQKADLATQAIDMLMFDGEVGKMLTPLAAMVGLPRISIALIFPTKKPDNMRPFLACLNSILSTALDEAVGLEEFTAKLAEAIVVIQTLARQEKETM